MEFRLKKDTPVYPMNKHWQFCVGSCHAAMALRADYARQLKFIHEELGIQYVRFHGILNDDMHTLDDFNCVIESFPEGDRIQERNFYLCGAAYDNVLACGMKPFVELSFMPQALAREKTNQKSFYGTNFNHPKDLTAWSEHLTSFIEYLLHRYGKEEVESWFFEVWNEPDLQGAFYLGSQEEYFELYAASVKAIKQVDHNLRVGGPATSGSKWITPFLHYCHTHDVSVDFISTHQYAGDPFTGIEDDDELKEKEQTPSIDKKEKLKQAMELIINDITDETTCLSLTRKMFGDPTETKDMPNDIFLRNSTVVKQQAADLPVYYTEWNLQATFSAYSNDTRKMAAYDIKTALDIEENVAGSSIWCFSDLFEEMHQFKEEFHGGFGMQTIHGIPKPVFYGMKMLAQTGTKRYDLGKEATKQEVGIAAFKSDAGRQLLLFRQKMKQVDLPAEPVQLIIECEQPLTRVTMQRIDEEHCNPLRIWEEQGCPADLNQQEVHDIIEQSRMEEEAIPYRVEQGILQMEVQLGVNDIYLIKLEE